MCLEILKNNNGLEVRNITINHSASISERERVSLTKIKEIFKVLAEIREAMRAPLTLV